jgi:anti-anti-sigma factor
MPQAKTQTSITGATIQVSRQADCLTIAVVGRFDFQCHQDFRRSYERAEAVRQVVIDLERTDYLDSSALGMLLLLRDSISTPGAVRIVRSSPAVKRILKIANIDQLITVE